VLFTLAQFIFILWPLVILAALIYSLQPGPVRRRSRWSRRIQARLAALGGRIRHNLLVTWTVLVAIWLVALAAPTPAPALIPEPGNTALFLGGYGVILLAEIARLGWFRGRLIARVNLHRARAIADLQAMDPYDFEGLITETYRALGFRVQHVGQSGDHGVDVELYSPEGEHWIVQCKRYRARVGESILRDLYGSMVADQAERAVLVTTAEITPPAREWAQGKPIELVDGPALLDLIASARERTEGAWFDRLAHTLSHLAAPSLAVETGPVAALAEEATRPARVIPAVPSPARQNGHIQYLRGVPICPRCHMPMVARPSRPGDPSGRVLYRCRNYPNCRVVLEHEPG
jgi:restriction system protein